MPAFGEQSLTEPKICVDGMGFGPAPMHWTIRVIVVRSEEHTSELQSLMRTSYAVFCLKKKNNINSNECMICCYSSTVCSNTRTMNVLDSTITRINYSNK